MDNISGVYMITCSINNKVYIGSSVKVKTRCCAHKNMLRNNKHHNIHLQSAWNKYGELAFTFSLVETVEAGLLLAREQYWIDYYQSCNDKNGYNISAKAGAPMAGLVHSEKTKAQYRATRKGASNANYKGISYTCELCGATFRRYGKNTKYCSQKCYHADKARFTPELKQKYSIAKKGRAIPRQQVEKSALSRMGEYIVTDSSGSEYHVKGLAAFCREHALDQGSMSHVVSGRRASYKGWKCRKA